MRGTLAAALGCLLAVPGTGAAGGDGRESGLRLLQSARCEYRTRTRADGGVERRTACDWPAEAARRLVLESRCAEKRRETVMGDGTRAERLTREEERVLFVKVREQGTVGHGGLLVTPFPGEADLLEAYDAGCEGRREKVRGWLIPPEIEDVPWVERYTTRSGGPCHWLALAPVEGWTKRLAGEAVAYDARTKHRAPAPALLADCCNAAGGIEQRRLAAFLTLKRLPGDPGAWQVTNPAHWSGVLWRTLAGGDHYDERGEVRLGKTSGRGSGRTWRWPVRVRRESVQWSTESGYEVVLPGAEVGKALRERGTYTLRIEAPGLESEVKLVTGEKTEAFVAACPA